MMGVVTFQALLLSPYIAIHKEKYLFWEPKFVTHLFIIPQDWVGLLLLLFGSLL